MASLEKRKDGMWRAFVARQGKRKSKSFPTKQAAKDWAARQEYLILNSEETVNKTPFREVLNRYANEVSPRKRGELWEVARLKRFCNEAISQIAIQDLTSSDLAKWRDVRVKEVANGTVNREMTLLSGVLTVARKEWGLISVNPIVDVRKPTKPPGRDRIVTDKELEVLELSAGVDLTKLTARAFHAFRFAIETAMRAGEIVGLTWDNIDLTSRVCHLPMTKNGTTRDVPLSLEAVRLLRALPPFETAFGLNSRQLDALWRKLRDRAAVENLTFHDSRHIAITRLSRKLEVLELARMVGHRNLNELLTYYNASAADIAKRLD